MEDLNTEEMNTVRHRSPTFNKQEVELLLDLVEKYRMYILNKAITSAACQAKESAWVKIARKFNSSGLGPTRSQDNLRIKWENLKRDARKVTKNVLETNKSDVDDMNVRILQLLTAMEHIGCIDAPQEMSEGEIDAIENGSEEQKDALGGFPKFWNENLESDGGDEHNEKSGSCRNTRSQNFSPQECKLLLQCVRKEKKHVFCKDLTGRAIEMKNHAWSRIADSYNKLSPQKRSSKMLRTKFMSMKKMAKKVCSKVPMTDFGKSEKQEKFSGNGYKNIKKEPLFEDRLDDDSDQCSNQDDTDFNGPDEGAHYIEVGGSNDPLSSVLNGDSGIGSSSSNMTWNWNQSENKEIVKLKLELLNYQLETAKLERKRLEDTMKEEEQARVAKETEQSLRLRAARIEATTAASRLPPNHPALHFPPEETRAHAYLTLTPYHHT